MTIRTFTVILFTIAIAMGVLLSVIVTEYDLPLFLVPFMAFGLGSILYDVHAAYVLRYLEDHYGE